MSYPYGMVFTFHSSHCVNMLCVVFIKEMCFERSLLLMANAHIIAYIYIPHTSIVERWPTFRSVSSLVHNVRYIYIVYNTCMYAMFVQLRGYRSCADRSARHLIAFLVFRYDCVLLLRERRRLLLKTWLPTQFLGGDNYGVVIWM